MRLLTLYLDVLHDVEFLAHDCLVLTEEIHFRNWERSRCKGGHDLVLNIDLSCKGKCQERNSCKEEEYRIFGEVIERVEKIADAGQK